jgi:hypothetical protein
MEKFANRLGYSDIEPFEVIRVVSDKCLEVRAMDSERDPEYKPEFAIGGFSAVCLNQAQQKWVIKSNPENRAMRIRLQKSGDWKSACGGRFALRDKPVRFYDYNF